MGCGASVAKPTAAELEEAAAKAERAKKFEATKKLWTLICEKGSADQVPELLEQGADMEEVTSWPWTAITAKSLAVEEVDIMGLSALQLAVRSDIEIVKLLLAAADKAGTTDKLLGAKVPVGGSPPRPGAGRTALHVAAAERQDEIIQMLLKQDKQEKDVKMGDGSTALHVAALCTKDRPKVITIVEALLEANFDANAKNNEEDTPLHLVLWDSVAEPLLKAKADVNAQNAKGNTPLHAAAIQGECGMVKALLAAGADTSIKNKKGLGGFQGWSSLGETADLNPDRKGIADHKGCLALLTK